MTRMAKHVALAVLLASAAAWVFAQDLLLPTDWPTKFRDAANTSSTPVLPPDTITPAWQIQTDAAENPRVYLTTSGEQVLISGNNIYQASDGTWLNSLPHTAHYGYTAITTTTTTDEQRIDVLLTGDGTDFDAYNLGNLLNHDPNDDQLLWSLHIPVDDESHPWLGRCRGPTARNGVFYLATTGQWIVRVDAASGENVVWKNLPGASINSGPPAVATIKDPETGQFKELVFVTIFRCGLYALDAASLEVVWSRPDIYCYAQPCVDEAAGVVYGHDELNGEWLVACDASNGATLWSAPLDCILNAPPTLGWAKDGNNELHLAVFVVTGGVDGEAGVYAFRRDNGDQLWYTTIPSDAWLAAVYCGCTGPDDPRAARLYIATNNNGGFGGYPYFGDTYVLDAFTGERKRVLGTDFLDPLDNACPVIVDVGGTPYMYVLTALGRIVAWKEGGGLPPPPVPQLSIEASPAKISINASAKVTVRLVNAAENDPPPLPGETIQFSSDAAKNQGYLNPVRDVTDDNGIATTMFYSQARTGVVTITAMTAAGRSATTTITITKGGEVPPTTGSIQGTVYYAANGKPAKKATVQLLDELAVVQTATTNPRGKYSFEEVPFGTYVVFAYANGTAGMTDVLVISESSPSVTSPEGNVYLE